MLRYWFAIGVLSVCYFVILYDTILHYFIYLFVILYDTMLFDTILYYITLSLLYDIILHHNISECVLPLYIYIYTSVVKLLSKWSYYILWTWRYEGTIWKGCEETGSTLTIQAHGSSGCFPIKSLVRDVPRVQNVRTHPYFFLLFSISLGWGGTLLDHLYMVHDFSSK